MQEKIKKKIIHNIIFATLFFILITSLLAGFFIARNYVNSFEDSSKQSIKLATSYSQIKLENIKNDSYRLSNNEVIIAGLETNLYAISINPKLNFLRSQYQEEISSLVLYASNNYIYKTDSISVSSIVPLKNLLENDQIIDFPTNAEETSFFIQHQDQIISHFSFIHKITSDDNLLGYLLINIRPTYLLSNYFSYQNSSTINLINQYIVVNDELLYFIDKEDIIISDEVGFSNINTYVIQENLYNDILPLITKVSTDNLVKHLTELLIVIAIIDIFTILLAYFSARRLALKISLRFMALQQKMLQAPEAIK